MSTKFLHIGSHTGHCHKWAHVSHAELHTLHLSVLSPDPLSHSPLWSMFLNQDDVSLLVPIPYARFSPMALHGSALPILSSQFLIQLGSTSLRCFSAHVISLTPILSSGSLPGEFRIVH